MPGRGAGGAVGWGWLEGARATGSCKARPGLRGTDSHRQRPGALRWAVSGPAPLASHAVRSGCVCPHPLRGPEAPASGSGRGSGSAPRRKSSAPPARLSFPGAVLALPLALTLPSGVHSRRPAPRRLPPSGGRGWSVCCENPGPGEQRVACQAGTSEVLGQPPSRAPGWPLPAPAPATLGPFAERSREQAGPHHISAQRAVLGAAVCQLRAPVCSRRTQSPTSGLTALAEDAPRPLLTNIPSILFLRK